MSGIQSSLKERLRVLLTDDTVLTPISMNVRRTMITAAVLLLVIGAIQAKALSGLSSVTLFALYVVGALSTFGMQFLKETHKILVGYCVGLIAAAILMLAHLPVLALIILQFGLYVIFYRFPLRRALLLSAIPTLLFIALAFTIHQNTPANNAPTVLFIIFLIYGFDIVTGITRRQNMIANQHLSWTREQLDREMARNAHLAIVRERTNIARDMHDILAHSLTALSVQLQAARQTIATDPDQATHLLDEMATTLRQSVAESRQLVQVLREATAPGDDDLTIAAQLQRVANRFSERTGLHVTLDEHGTPYPLPAETATALRYIVQEALTNAFRHGNAHQMTITLDWSETALSLRAEDDGTPQLAPSSTDGGNGLRGMRERMEALGGTFSAGPRAEQGGFAVRIIVPYLTVREKQAV